MGRIFPLEQPYIINNCVMVICTHSKIRFPSIRILAPSKIRHTTLSKLLNFTVLYFLIFKMGIIKLPNKLIHVKHFGKSARNMVFSQ